MSNEEENPWKIGEYEMRIDWRQGTVWVDNNELYEANSSIMIDFEDFERFLEILQEIKEEIKKHANNKVIF